MNPNAPAFVPSFAMRAAARPAQVEPMEEVAEVEKVDRKGKAEEEGAKDSWEDDVDQAVAGVEKMDVKEEVGAAVKEEVRTEKVEMEQEKKHHAEVAEDKAGTLEGEANADAEHDIIANLDGNGDGKKHVNVVFIGHVDAGKSTISGHILFATGGVDERTMDKFERDAKAVNRESWKYAWALDTTDQERSKGKTEECGRATFTTETKKWTILDAPGHKDFVPHMIGGASQADVAILVISARKGEFETGFERGGQTREHAMLAKTSGVRSLIVVINKMDDPSIPTTDGTWSKTRYDECQTKLMPFLKQVGWKPSDVTWLPISGLKGLNLKDPVPKDICPWYEGESLLDTLEHLKPPERLVNAAVRLPIFEKYREMGTIIMGKIESGLVQTGKSLLLMPSKAKVLIEGIQLETGDELTVAEPGDNVRVRLRGVEEEDIKIGYILCSEENAVSVASKFDVKLMILEHRSIITAGYSGVMHVHAAVVECSIEKLLAVLDKKTGEIASKHPRFAKPGMSVIARIATTQPVCVTPFKEFAQLGRFMLRDEGRTVGVGVILKIRESNSNADN